MNTKKLNTLEQFPKDKNISGLSEDQKRIRVGKSKYYFYDPEFVCVKCGNKQAISEFYVADRVTGRRRKSCRDCIIRSQGVIEVGKFRFSKKILTKGFRRCNGCKNIKPLKEFPKSKKSYAGFSHLCYECSKIKNRKYVIEQRSKIGLFYVKQYGKAKGILIFTKDVIDKLRKEITENRKPIFFLDGLEFNTIASFATYIQDRYKLPITMTEKRISKGKSEYECTLSESEMRRKFSGTIKGRIKVIDTITGVIMEFSNTTDEGLKKMFSNSTITKCIKTGEKTKITSLSKYKNPCTISRIL